MRAAEQKCGDVLYYVRRELRRRKRQALFIVKEPKVLLADEPTGNLGDSDPEPVDIITFD